MILDQPCVIPFGSGQRPRDHNLGQAIHQVGDDWIVLDRVRGWPIACHELIRHASEQKGIHRACLFDGEFIEFLVHVVPTYILIWSLKEAIERDHVE